MSLAFNAASFEDSNEDLIQKKRQAHNKTQKQYPKDKFDAEKVNSMLHQMQKQELSGTTKYNDGSKYNENKYNNDAGSDLGDFVPQTQQMLSPPQSAGVARTLKNVDSINQSDLDANNLDQNYGNAEEYYKRVLNHQTQSYDQPITNGSGKPDALMQKINYMINLLEEQQDERTNNVTEEVVLYSFLGIFVIFVVDSFVKVGKYVR
jgi:hypothetical protein